jgi:hypothetical protein
VALQVLQVALAQHAVGQRVQAVGPADHRARGRRRRRRLAAAFGGVWWRPVELVHGQARSKIAKGAVQRVALSDLEARSYRSVLLYIRAAKKGGEVDTTGASGVASSPQNNPEVDPGRPCGVCIVYPRPVKPCAASSNGPRRSRRRGRNGEHQGPGGLWGQGQRQ